MTTKHKAGTPEWEESERKRKAEYNRKEKENRRAVPAVTARRARQVGGMLVPVKSEVPHSPVFCHKCGGRTSREQDADGRRECSRCRPSRPLADRSQPRVYAKPKNRKQRPLPRLLPGRVHRLCIACDVAVQKMPAEVGPFMCHRCKDRARNRGATNHVGGTRDKRVNGEDVCPIRAARVALLGALYEKVEGHPNETAAREAGLVTSVSDFQFPEVLNHDPVAIADNEDEDDATGDGEGS